MFMGRVGVGRSSALRRPRFQGQVQRAVILRQGPMAAIRLGQRPVIQQDHQRAVTWRGFTTSSSAGEASLPGAIKMDCFHAAPRRSANGEAEQKDNKIGVVIIHGLLGTKSNWTAISKALAKKTKKDVFAVDLRGHGSSPHGDGVISYSTMTLDLQDFLASVKRQHNISRVVLIGHSLGGRLLMHASLSYAFVGPTMPDIGHQVLVDVSPKEDNVNPNGYIDVLEVMRAIEAGERKVQSEEEVRDAFSPYSSCKRFQDFLMSNLVKRDKSDEEGAEAPPSPFKFRVHLAGLIRFLPNLSSFLPANSSSPVQSTFVVGTNSPYISLPEDERGMKQHFPNYSVEAVDAGHWVHADKPSKLIELLRRVVEGVK